MLNTKDLMMDISSVWSQFTTVDLRMCPGFCVCVCVCECDVWLVKLCVQEGEADIFYAETF